MKKTHPLISIVISNYNGVKLNILRDCLTSFKKIDYPNYEILLIDNASTDNSLDVANKILGKNSRFKIIKNPVNIYSQGLNLGLRESKGEFVAYFNNDLEIEKRYFHELLSAFERYPQLALAQGKLLWYFDHSVIDSAGETMDIFGNPVTLGNKIKDDGRYDKEEEILSASGSACILKKATLKKVGKYGAGYGIGYEDMDLALRLRHRSYKVMRIPSAICYHKRGATDLSQMVRTKVKWHFNKNRIQTMIRNYPTFLLLKSLPVTVLIYFGIMIWEGFFKRNIAIALTRPKSLFWVIENLPTILKERRKIRKLSTKKTDKEMLALFTPSNLFYKIVLFLKNPRHFKK